MKKYLLLICLTYFSLTSCPAASLVARWDFENSGNLGLDSSGLGNHASTVVGINQVTGFNGTSQAAAFNNTASSFQVAPLNGYTGFPGFSFVAWVNVDSSSSGHDGIISQDSGACCETRFMVDPDNRPFLNIHQHSDQVFGPVLPFNTWFHYALTVENTPSGAKARVYVNGVEVSGSPRTFAPLGSSAGFTTYLGAGEAGNVHHLKGALDEVQIYEGTLAANEVVTLFENQTLAVVPEPAAWMMVGLGIGIVCLRRRAK